LKNYESYKDEKYLLDSDVDFIPREGEDSTLLNQPIEKEMVTRDDEY